MMSDIYAGNRGAFCRSSDIRNGFRNTAGDCQRACRGGKFESEGRVYAEYADISFFNERDRWKVKETKKM